MAPKGRGRKKAIPKLPKGTILTDVFRLQWKIIEPIGEGGFGVIYSVEKVISTSKDNTSYVAKVEPYANGPLFVEKNFFIRNLQPKMIDEYKREKNISFLGLPEYIGAGVHEEGDIEYRFLIMERFGDNINKKLKTANKVNYKLLGTFCTQIIDALKYIHERGVAHMDIKPENLLLKLHSNDDKVYLIDFGIVDRCTTEDTFKPDKKKQHNGTPLYTSRDSHQGVVTKRGDFEILGYNILQWLGVELPWANDLKNAVTVAEKKNKFISNIKNILANKVSEKVIEYFNYIGNLEFNEDPDYDYIKSLLQGLESPNKDTSKKRKSDVDSTPSPKRTALSDEVSEKENIKGPSGEQKPAVEKRNAKSSSPAKSRKKKTTSETAKKTIEPRSPKKRVLSVNIPVTAAISKTTPKKRITSPPKKTTVKKILSPKRIMSRRKTRNVKE